MAQSVQVRVRGFLGMQPNVGAHLLEVSTETGLTSPYETLSFDPVFLPLLKVRAPFVPIHEPSAGAETFPFTVS